MQELVEEIIAAEEIIIKLTNFDVTIQFDIVEELLFQTEEQDGTQQKFPELAI